MTNIQSNTDKAPEANSSISDQLFHELFNTTLDLSTDYTEIFVDDLIENGVLKEIPIVKSIVGIFKSGVAISQFWFAKKILTFIKQFNNGQLSAEKIASFKAELDKDEMLGKRIAEKLMIFIDRNIEIKQTQIIANLFAAHVNGDMTFEEFNHIVIGLDHLNPKSYSAFFDLAQIGFKITAENHEQIGPRNFEMESMITSSGFSTPPSPYFSGFELTPDGQKLFEFGLKPFGN